MVVSDPVVLQAGPEDLAFQCDICECAQDQVVVFALAHLCFDCAQTQGKELQKLGKRLEGKIRRQQEKQAKELNDAQA